MNEIKISVNLGELLANFKKNETHKLILDKYNVQYDVVWFNDIDQFIANFRQAFSNDEFPVKTRLVNIENSSVIFNDLMVHSKQICSPNIEWWEYCYFRLVVSLLFCIECNIFLKQCACYPKTADEFKLFKSNVSLNNIDRFCTDRLFNNPNEIDIFSKNLHKNLNVQHLVVKNTINSANNATCKITFTN